MDNRITIFVGRDASALFDMLKDYVCVREFKYERDERSPMLSESDFILYCLGKRYEGGFIDEVSVARDNGELEPVFFDDFISRLDESVDVRARFKELLDIGVPIFYFAERTSSASRLAGLPVCVYNEE